MDPEPDKLDQGNSPQPPGAVTIKIFSAATDAEAAAALLEANEITCWLSADDCGGMLSVLDAAHGVKLLVLPADADEAKALLAATPVVATGLPAEDSPPAVADPTSSYPRLRLSLPQIIAGIVVGVLLCLLYQWTAKLGTKSFRRDANGDGRTDTVWIYRDGDLVECQQDRSHDGVLDSWAYYEHGEVVRAEMDNDFDGKPDETWTYSNGDLVSMEKDTDFNGTPDIFCTYNYGIIQQLDIKPNDSKFTTEREFYQHGVLKEAWRGGDSNGNFREAVQYDPFFNPISTNTPPLQWHPPASK
jgi:hypothetical protein